MPGIIFEDTLTDRGSSNLGGGRVYYVAWEVVTLGPTVRHPSYWDLDQLVGVGHFELGNDVTAAGILSGDAFDAPHWFNTELGQWIVPPGEIGTDFSRAIASRIRWAIAPGSEVHLYILGDT